MKSLLATVFLLSALFVQDATLQAQGVFVSPGENGPVYSDKPNSGAREVNLPPLNVVTPPPKPAAASIGDPVKRDAEAPLYRSFSIVFPEGDSSVIANTAVFAVRVALDPPLAERHAIVVSINGRPVEQRFTATEFMIPPEFWGDNLPPPFLEIQLDASIVDANGQALMKAAPIRFFLRHSTIQS